MSIDALARRAGDQSRSATSTLDVESALTAVTVVRPAQHRRHQLVAVAAAALLAVVGAAAVASVRSNTEQAQPIAPHERAIGDELAAPVALAQPPRGWLVTEDGRFIELTRNASGITISVPMLVNQPPRYEVQRLRGDLVSWIQNHPAVTVVSSYAVTVDGFPAMRMNLRLPANQVPEHADQVGRTELVELTKLPRYSQVVIYPGRGTFCWTVIDIDGAQVLVSLMSPHGPEDNPDTLAYQDVLDNLDLG